MYSLDCSYYDKEFETLNLLLNEMRKGEMDPNYEITYNGKGTGETAWDLIGETV